MRSALAIAIAVLACVQSAPVRAYTVQTGFTDGCHERITAAAFVTFAEDPAWRAVVVPQGDTWRKLAQPLEAWLLGQGVIEEALGEQQLFVLFSLIVGVRAPDTNGRSVSDLATQRNIHASPLADAQYLHALRAPSDDEPEGSQSAVAGTRRSVREAFSKAVSAVREPSGTQVFGAPVTIDFYDLFEVEVWRPGFLLGEAMHTVQDSFSHSIRSEARGWRELVHVLNYVDAINHEFEESRDGIAHSRHLDRCDAADLQALTAAASMATADLVATFLRAQVGDDSAIDEFLEQWLTLQEGCSAENMFCDNETALAAARQDPTDPILPDWMTCSAVVAPVTGGFVSFAELWLLLGLASRIRRRGLDR